jgi:hypothetical protein
MQHMSRNHIRINNQIIVEYGEWVTEDEQMLRLVPFPTG